MIPKKIITYTNYWDSVKENVPFDFSVKIAQPYDFLSLVVDRDSKCVTNALKMGKYEILEIYYALLYVYKYGGYYCPGNYFEINENSNCVVKMCNERMISLNYFGAEKGHPFILDILNAIDSADYDRYTDIFHINSIIPSNILMVNTDFKSRFIETKMDYDYKSDKITIIPFACKSNNYE